MTWLERFNRKERFALVAHALGTSAFRLDREFLGELTRVCELDDLPVDNSHGWMDYHLDWLYAALVVAHAPPASLGPFPSPDFPLADGSTMNINTNQEDIDLLVTVAAAGVVHLFLVEAKWQSSWSTDQMASKLRRLTHIFGEDGTRYRDIVPHLILVSTAQPKLLTGKLKEKKEKSGESLPDWVFVRGEIPWLRLNVPANRATIQRTDADGKASKTGESWILKYEPTSG